MMMMKMNLITTMSSAKLKPSKGSSFICKLHHLGVCYLPLIIFFVLFPMLQNNHLQDIHAQRRKKKNLKFYFWAVRSQNVRRLLQNCLFWLFLVSNPIGCNGHIYCFLPFLLSGEFHLFIFFITAYEILGHFKIESYLNHVDEIRNQT